MGPTLNSSPAPDISLRSSNNNKRPLWKSAAWTLTIAALGLSAAATAVYAAPAPMPQVALTRNYLPACLAWSPRQGLTDPSRTIGFELALQPRDAAEILDLEVRLKNPHDPMFGHYLTPAQYKAQFGRTESDLAQIAAYAKRHNFTVVEVKPNNLFVRMTGRVSDINAAFGVTLQDYASTDTYDAGRIFHAPDRQPVIDSDIAPLVKSVVGLSSAALPRPDFHMSGSPVAARAATYQDSLKLQALDQAAGAASPQPAMPSYTGNAGLAPFDTSDIYQMSSIVYASTPVNGTGQVMGLGELGTFTAGDIKEFEEYYGYPTPYVPLNIHAVDGFDTSEEPGGDSGEITLDLDMFLAWGYGAKSYEIYEATDNPTSADQADSEFTDIFTDMANASTLPNVISISYYSPEVEFPESDTIADAEACDQLAIQGQTVLICTGDSAAWVYQPNTSEKPNVAEPADVPSVVAVGGTDLADTQKTDSSGDPYEVYKSESSWYAPSATDRGPLGDGSGGGISTVFNIPFYQVGSFDTSVNTQGSTKMRNLPDVSLFGDYNDGGYDVYFTDYANNQQGWISTNGTSASTPLWAGLLACVNQERVTAKVPMLGEANPDIYNVAESKYSADFHDIDDNSTNGYYKAVKGYDDSTGWGSPNNGAQLVADLAAAPTYIEWELQASASSVTSGKTLSGVIVLPLDAIKDSKFSLKSSNSSALSVPSSVTVSNGKQDNDFTITAGTVSAATKVTLTATYYGYSESVSITVNPATSSSGLKSVSLDPTSTTGGTSTTASRVYWNGNAPANETVTLKSSNTNVATVPSSLTISSGSSSHTFTITTKSVTSSTNVTITATNGSTSQTATLTVTPSTSSSGLKSVGLSPTSTTGGTSTTANRVYWNGNAPANEMVTLKSSNTSVVTVPSSVTISSGSSSHTFTVNTASVFSSTNVTITATCGGVTQTATLTVTPASSSGVAVSSLSLNPSSVAGGSSSTGTVTLTGDAPSGGTVVTLSTSNTSSSNVPSSVTVASGSKTATFTVKTASVFSNTSVTISAAGGGATKTATLTITPASTSATLSKVSLSPSTVTGGDNSTGTVTLTSAAPSSGLKVSLSTSNTSSSNVPSSVTVAVGSTTATFTVKTASVFSNTSVTITATAASVSKTATLTIDAS